jgi:hypothetical protein
VANESAKELGELLGRGARESIEIKETGFGSEQYGFNQINAYDDIRSPSTAIEINKQLIGDAFILGHPVNGQLGTSPFTLGATDLGASSKVYVGHAANTYVERFGITRFIDTGATTATISTSDFTCTFSDSVAQTLQTSQIFFDDITSTTVSNVTVLLSGLTVQNGLVSVATDGSTFVEVVQNEATAVTAGNDLRVKVTNGAGALGWPTEFGTWGSASIDPLTITQLTVIYS